LFNQRICDIVRSMMRRALLLLAILCLPGFARVTRMVVESRQSPAYQGRTFGAAGAYEKLTGRVFGELDPANPLNAIVTDILLAPRNARGMVEYAATFTLLQPVDLTKASGVLIYDVPNRGNHLLLGAFQGGEPGDGFFFERGDIILASGWQGDLIPHAGTETIDVPVARNPDGSSIAGAVFGALQQSAGGHEIGSAARRIAARFCQLPRRCHARKADFRRRRNDPYRGRRLGFRRLQPDALSRHPQPRKVVPQRRL
jgi:hypothetical protein